MEGREIAQYELRTKVALNAHLDQVYDTIINPIIRKSCRIVANFLRAKKNIIFMCEAISTFYHLSVMKFPFTNSKHSHIWLWNMKEPKKVKKYVV